MKATMRREVSFQVFAVLLLISWSGVDNVAKVDAAVSLNKPVKLMWHYYRLKTKCPNAEAFIKHLVKKYWTKDKTIAAQLLRLTYTDCFVTGCDGSILLDGANSEKTAPQNRGLGAFDVIDKIKRVLEVRCPGIVSCSDILNLATRDAVHLAGAPSYPVYTGRKDGMSSNAALVDLPPPSISVQDLLPYFASKGLDVLDMVTLLGAHSLGKTDCTYVKDRLYNFKNTGKPDPSMATNVVNQLRKQCPSTAMYGQYKLFLNPDSGSSYRFSASYYKRVIAYKSVLGVDQQLMYGNITKLMSAEFGNNFEDLRKSFALSMNRMGSINVLTGDAGEIRKNCRYTNKNNPYL